MLGQVFLQEHDPQICVLVGEGRQARGVVNQLQGGEQGADLLAVREPTELHQRKALLLQGFFQICNSNWPMVELC